MGNGAHLRNCAQRIWWSRAASGREKLRQIRPATILSACALALALAACGPDPDVDARDASVEEVAEQVRQAGNAERFIQPGKWVSTVTFQEMTAPGMPPQAAEQMKQMMGQGQQFESCLTKEEAARPGEEFFAGNQNNQCRYEHFTMGGGKIDAKMRCDQGQVTQVMEMDGSYSPDTYQMRMTTSFEGAPEPAGGMRMRMRIDAKRAGECDAAAGS